MTHVRPFSSILPKPSLAKYIIAPPYDVLSREEAIALANPYSFLHITRPDVEDPVEKKHKTSKSTFEKFLRDGVLVEDPEVSFYLYKLEMNSWVQIGLISACSVHEYLEGLIRKHEHTLPDKELDRADHMDEINAQVGLVFLTYRDRPKLKELLAAALERSSSLWSVETEDQVKHTLYRIPDSFNTQITEAFLEVPALYIADGHHRTAAAAEVYRRNSIASKAWFIGGLFPDTQLNVLAYNRVIRLAAENFQKDVFFKQMRQNFIEHNDDGPLVRGEFRIYCAGLWTRWRTKNFPENLYERLDVSIVHDQLLAPFFGILDPRRDHRIEYVGGIRGTIALQEAVDQGASFAIELPPTGLDQMFDLADQGKIMPPKSTWFEPKLREGVISRRFDREI